MKVIDFLWKLYSFSTSSPAIGKQYAGHLVFTTFTMSPGTTLCGYRGGKSTTEGQRKNWTANLEKWTDLSIQNLFTTAQGPPKWPTLSSVLSTQVPIPPNDRYTWATLNDDLQYQ